MRGVNVNVHKFVKNRLPHFTDWNRGLNICEVGGDSHAWLGHLALPENRIICNYLIRRSSAKTGQEELPSRGVNTEIFVCAGCAMSYGRSA